MNKKQRIGAGAAGAEAKAKVDLFEKLPNCLQQAVCQFLDLKSRSRTVQTCKQGKIALSPLAWPPDLHLEFGIKQEFTEWFFKRVQPAPKCRSLFLGWYLQGYDEQLATLFTPNLKRLHVLKSPDFLVPDTLCKAPSLEHIDCMAHVIGPLLDKFPNLVSARLNQPDHQVMCPSLQSPSLTNLKLSNWLHLPIRISMPKLQTLTIDMKYVFEFDLLSGVFNQKDVPNLTDLYLMNNDGARLFDSSLALGIHRRLKQFKFEVVADTVAESLSRTICPVVENSRDYLKESRLERLEMYVSDLESFRGWEFFFDRLNQMPRLRRVVLELYPRDGAELDPNHLVPILKHVANRDNAPAWTIISNVSNVPNEPRDSRVLNVLTKWV